MMQTLTVLRSRLDAFFRARKFKQALASGLPAAASRFWADGYDNGQPLAPAVKEEFVSLLQREFALLACAGEKFEVSVSSRGVHQTLISAAIAAGLVDAGCAPNQLGYQLPHGSMVREGELLVWRSYGRNTVLWYASQLARIMHEQSATAPDWVRALSFDHSCSSKT